MSEKPPQDNTENNNEKSPDNFEESYESHCNEFQKTRDEKLKEFYNTLGDTIERHKAEFRTASFNVLGGIGGIFEKMGK